ncbi:MULTISPECIES: formate/nitrite transporter family protein [unclassified Fusibacter]|uniref:formate/nitrite transporter family protein n=1 Tax=unclassified Fusibacter TaxID=2624464 RepID=UPI0010123C5B|nr:MULTISPECIES: formate/nitrite transporter family protein [unclassified Fusibacter]MCK8060500.1 formate/nitrite transporter family protein [Fusibacter sp. A2]NPE20211.1 formate/nitrite transporter family protein [Fusibacter sp. A1]RXV63420.1 formate/nitrite transporter family protein [Fusibacter sp. A1]
MYKEMVEKFSLAAEGKIGILKKNPMRYLLLSAMAGIFVGLGIILIFSIGGTIGDSPFKKTLMGASFGIALSLVIMIGSELFTGNNMIMTVASLNKRVTWIDSLKVWLVSYTGNLLGSIAVGLTFVLAGLASGGVLDFINKVSAAKMAGSFSELFFKGVLCNMLVCLAVFAAMKLKEETAKLIMIWWCLFAFITSGFEHSIANMTLFSISLFAPHAATVSLSGAVANLIPVTLGNFVGGAIVIGASYYFIGKE